MDLTVHFCALLILLLLSFADLQEGCCNIHFPDQGPSDAGHSIQVSRNKKQ